MSELDALLRSGTGRTVLDALFNSTPSLVFVADSEGRILRASRFAADLTGFAAEAFEGRPATDLSAILKTGDRDGRLLGLEELPVSRALEGELVLGAECTVVNRSGERIPMTISAAPLRTANGRVVGAITSGSDLRRAAALERELRAVIAEKEVLYRELAHRVKNHFQLIASVVTLCLRNPEEDAAELARRVIAHLKMLAAVYDRINQADVGGRICARTLLEDVVSPYRTDSIAIGVSAPKGLTLQPDEAGPLGMLVNEAVNNSFKYAFPGRGGRIEVSLQPSSAGRLELKIADDGVGFAGPVRQGAQGVELMRLLAQQLGGEFETSNRAEGGAQVVVDLPASLAQG